MSHKSEAQKLGGYGRGLDNKKSRTTKHNHDRLIDKRRINKNKKDINEEI